MCLLEKIETREKKMSSGFVIPEQRDQLIITAKLAEQCERYDEILLCIKRAIKINAKLESDERNLLSVAYKNIIGARRTCWRSFATLVQKEEAKKEGNMALINGFKRQVEKEIAEICNDVFDLVVKYLIPAADTDESKVYFYKLKADYHRYYAEIESGSENQKNLALESYLKASEYVGSLKPTSPIRLGLALNFSVFYYEILKSPDRGCQLARKAFDEAVEVRDVQDDDKEAALIMQLLRENLNLWTEDVQPDVQDDGTAMEELE